MKGKFIKTYHILLIQNHFEEFEPKLSIHFLTYFGKVLPLQYFYTDWFVIQLQPLRKQTFSLTGLKVDYLIGLPHFRIILILTNFVLYYNF